MKIHAQRPSAPLQDLVRRFFVIEFSEARADLHLPEIGLIAAFRLRGECLVGGRRVSSPAILSGLTNRIRQHQHSRDNAMLVVHFTPLGASSFIRQPLDDLWDRSEDLGELLGRAASLAELVDRLLETSDHPQRIQIVEQYLLAHRWRDQPDSLIRAAVDWIVRAPPASRVSDLTRYIGLSERALERRFRQRVGTAPKRFMSLVRLNHAAELLQSGASLTSVAHASGYYDQAHFNHEFRSVTGLTPTYYATQICNAGFLQADASGRR